MGSKRLGIVFLASVIAAFIFGLLFSRTLIVSEKEENIFDIITSQIKEEYLYDGITEQDEHEAFIAYMNTVIQSYSAKYNDPYTRLVAIPKESTNPEVFVGIGITLMYESTGLRVTDVQIDGQGFQKLYPNDLIIGVEKNGVDYLFANLRQQTMISYLAGAKDSTHTLIVLNPDEQQKTVPTPTKISIIYEEIPRPSAFSNDLGETHIHYLRITEFNQQETDNNNNVISIGTNNLFRTVREDLEDKMIGNKGDHTVILDLRNNPGGSVSAVHNIVQQLLPNTVEPLFTLTPRVGNTLVYRGAAGVDYDLRVLVNGSSASAAEVLASVLQEEGYTIYGNKTYGKDVYQSIARGSDGSYTPLMTVGNIDYHLYLTLGNWTYGKDNKNVVDNPIVYTEINQRGYLAIESLFYIKEVGLDDVLIALGNFQKFLNTYYDENIRTDGYFDLDTENLIERYQIDNGLTVTKKLDLLTSRHIVNTWITEKNKIENDYQLQVLINIIKDNE